MKSVQLALTAAACLLTVRATAGDFCCLCGHDDGVRKVCRLVCDVDYVVTHCYGCKCEDRCLPGRICRGDRHAECVELDHSVAHCCNRSPMCRLTWFDWRPTCASVRTVNRLVKYELVREVPSWRWVVEDVCCDCCPAECCEEGLQPGDPPVEVIPPDSTTDRPARHQGRPRP